MALQVWLPLNGNLNNQGLTNVTVTNSGATVDNAGKIGKCYSFTQSQYLVLNNVPFSKLSNCTICFWIYLASNESWLPCTGGNAGSNTGQYFLATSGGTGAFYHSQIGSNTVTIYRDGVVGTSPLASGSWHHYCITGLDLSTWSGITINHYATYTDWNFTGKMNDFRIYDHCLSPKEVKEISKGLVLHYKLDDPYVEATVNIASSLTPQANKGGWDKLTATQLGLNSYHFKHKTTDSSNLSYWSTFVYTLPPEYANKTISFSARLKNIKYDKLMSNGSTSWLFIGQGNDGQYPTHGSVTKTFTQLEENMVVSWTGTLSNSYRYLVIELWNNAATVDGYIELDVTDIQIEQKDHVTPYTSSSRSQGVVYDSSGYGYNGTITGSLTSEVPSPRYTYDTKFDGHNCYFLAKNPFYNNVQPLTVAFWFKPNSSNASYNTIVSNTYPHGGFWLSANTEGAGCWSYNNGLYVHGASGTLSNNQWYHMVWQYKGNNQYQWYLNGSTITTTTKGTLKAPVFTEYFSVGGCQCSDSSTSSSRYDQYGSISDLRFYAAVLSADDVKELYNTSAYIYNDGTVAAIEFDEDGTNLAIDVEKARIQKSFSNGLTLYSQSNCSCTLTDDGYRIYRGPNLTVANNGNTMWGGFVIDNTDNRFNFQKGHTYMIQFEVKGKTSNSIADIYWTNLVGWEGGGLYPNPSDVVIANPVTSNYNSSEWKTFTYKWTINDDVYKVCTTAYHTYVQGETYLSYKGFKYGFGYTSTGELGTDLYIRNIRMYDVTNQTPIDITKTGKIDANNITEETLPAEMTMGGVVGREIIEI